MTSISANLTPRPVGRNAALFSCAATCGLALLTAATAHGQEAYRASLAGQAAAEARNLEKDNTYYNLKLGPVKLRFSVQQAIEANDNVNLSKDDPQGDLILSPQLNTTAIWRISEKNRLTISTGVGYRYYVDGTEPDSFYLTPGSALSFDLFVEDFVINFHDYFSYTPSVANDPQVSGVGSLETLDNTSGVGVTWDLNQAVLRWGYDHVIYKVYTSGYTDDDRTMDLLNTSAGFHLSPTTIVGPQVSGGFQDNKGSDNPDSSHIAGGVFYSADYSEYLTLRASGGYVAYFFSSSSGNTNGGDSTVSAFYFDLAVKHRASATYAHTLSAGRSLSAGYNSDTTDSIYANYTAIWKLFRKTSFNYTLSFEHFENAQDTQNESDTGERYGFGIGLARPLTQKLNGTLNYHYYNKQSRDSSQGYNQNQLVLTLIYSF